jgi:hypothetical protein
MRARLEELQDDCLVSLLQHLLLAILLSLCHSGGLLDLLHPPFVGVCLLFDLIGRYLTISQLKFCFFNPKDFF